MSRHYPSRLSSILFAIICLHSYFSDSLLYPPWTKRVDGTNIYDGKPFHEISEQLHLREYPRFRRDFHSLLTHRERLRLLRRELTYRLRIRLHLSTKSELATKLRIPDLISPK